MSVVGVAPKICAMCDTAIEEENNFPSVPISSKHPLLPGVESIKAAMKLLIACVPSEFDVQNDPLVDSVLKDDDHICNRCLEKLGEGYILYQGMQGAERLLRFAFRQG